MFRYNVPGDVKNRVPEATVRQEIIRDFRRENGSENGICQVHEL